VSLHRGTVYPYKPVLARPGQSLQRLIVSADPLNESSLPVVLGLQVVDRDPESLLSVRLEGHGWAVITAAPGHARQAHRCLPQYVRLLTGCGAVRGCRVLAGVVGQCGDIGGGRLDRRGGDVVLHV
jgi:hypothetical protein